MTDATIEKYIDLFIPGLEAVRLTVSDANTYTSRKFAKVTGAVVTVNEDSDLDINVTNSDGTTIDGTLKGVRFQVSTGSALTCTLLLFGHK